MSNESPQSPAPEKELELPKLLARTATAERKHYRSPLAVKRWKDKIKLKDGEARSPLKFREVRSADEVAEIMGLTRQRIQQIEREAISKLRMGLKEMYEEYCVN